MHGVALGKGWVGMTYPPREESVLACLPLDYTQVEYSRSGHSTIHTLHIFSLMFFGSGSPMCDI